MNRCTSVLILTAISHEYSAVRRHLQDVREERNSRGTPHEIGHFVAAGGEYSVRIVQTLEPGNEGAALTASEAINEYSPSIVMFVGVAGGLKDVDLGDVVIATKVYGYAAGAADHT